MRKKALPNTTRISIGITISNNFHPQKKLKTVLVAATHVAAFTSFMRATSKAKKATLSLFSVAVLLAGGTVAAVRGQSALDGFDPNANDKVRVVVVQPDGKILMGGDFTALSPNGGPAVTRNRIARLNPDGTLDTAFNPSANNSVYAIALQADGKILVGGFFNGANSIGGQPRNFIARLEAATGSADSFNPNANGDVVSIAVQADGKILAGGDFTVVGAQTRNRIARLDATTGLADSFNPNANECCLCHRGAGGRQDFSGRHFQRSEQHRRSDAQPYRPARCHDRPG